MAEGVFRHLVRQAGLEDIVKVASAGTHAFHLGEVPDKRAQAAAAKRGFDVSDLRAKRVKEKDFDDFDLILAMDWDNLSALQQVAPKRTHHKLQLLIGPIAVQLDEKIQLLAARQSLDLQPRELQIAPFIVR